MQNNCNRTRASAAVTVTFSASGGETAVQRHEISAVSGAAREYGYDAAYFDHNGVRVQGVTVLDVLVAAHEELYGDGFTAESKDEYLVVNSGFITKAFGQSAASSGFIVNGVVPNDGIYNPDYYGFTGYSCDTAVLNDGDAVSYFFYRDTKYYADYYSWFDSETYTANEGEALTVNLNGYSAMYYGFNSWQTILDRYAKPLEGVEIYTYIGGEKTLLGVTDKNGNAKISFSGQGRYIIFAEGSAPDEDGELVPVIVPYAEVTVNVKQNEKPDRMTFCEWIKHVWKVIYKWFAEVFNFLFGWISDVC